MTASMRIARTISNHPRHRSVDTQVNRRTTFVQLAEQCVAVEAVMLPESFTECVLRMGSQAVIPSTQRPRFPIGAFLPKGTSTEMGGFRRSPAAEQAGQRANPRQIGVIAPSASVLGLADQASVPSFHLRTSRNFWVRCTPGITRSRSRSKARLIATLSASGLCRMYSFGSNDTLSTCTALGQQTS